MRSPLKAFGPALALLFVALGSSAAHADEGMWTFDNFPSAMVNAKYGTAVDQAWLDRVRGAAVRLSTGCSASVVSSEGLVLTNHHCIRNCVQDLSTARTDYIRDGFSAARREDERLCPDMQAEILDSMTDVTVRIVAATAGMAPDGFKRARDAEIAAIEKDSCAGRETAFRCQVVTLYQGGRYELYAYRVYSDVRLVFAPERVMAFFGGDPDNFNFPRYDLDCAFVRLYENGQPVATPGHLPWRLTPPKDGEPVFVAGNPGSTQRLLTAEQLESLRDFALPDTLLMFSELRGRLIRFAEESPEHRRTSEALLFGIENSFKALHGQEEALVDPALIMAKRAADQDLRARVAKDAQLAKAIGNPWGDIARVQTALADLNRPYLLMEQRAGMGSNLFGYARALVRAAQERIKPNGDRLPEYGEGRLSLLHKTVLDARPVYPDVEQLALEFWLSKLRENLTADAAGTKTFLGKESPEAISARLVTSKLGDPAVRKQLWDGGLAAIAASDDPMIRFVLATDSASRDIRKQYEDRVTNPADSAAQQIARARFAIYGTKTYPDATFSLRLSYGKIEGWTEHGTAVPSFTYLGGLWDRATGETPFALAPRWADAQASVNPATVFDFASDIDIIGGNSGAPMIDAQGRVVGAVFDGNSESRGGAFGFDDTANRGVAVTTVAITEALQNVYKNDALVAELTRP
jgi:hypothetical protein